MSDQHSPTTWRRVLAVDTSTLTQSVALLDGDALLGERTLTLRRGHASKLLASIDAMLQDLGLPRDAADLYVVGAGPGSFTGLRIGMACLKGLAFAQRKPLLAHSSLAAMAAQAGPGAGLIVPLFDARKREVYTGLYRHGVAKGDAALHLDTIVADRALGPAALVEAILNHRHDEEPITLLGPGLKTYGEALRASLTPHTDALNILGASYGHPRAAHLAVLARQAARADAQHPLELLEPNYQRLSDAEVKFGPPGKMR